jgi:hypothetical protein
MIKNICQSDSIAFDPIDYEEEISTEDDSDEEISTEDDSDGEISSDDDDDATHDISNAHIVQLQKDSVEDVCGESSRVLVYGWGHCKYLRVKTLLSLDFDKKVFLHSFFKHERKYLKLFDYRWLVRFSRLKNGQEEFFKSTLTSFVFENYRLELENRRLNQNRVYIPILFCIDIDNDPYETKKNYLSILTRDLQRYATHSELRRCYKLCYGIQNDPELAEIAEVARRSLIFIKLEPMEDKKYKLVKVPAYWENEKYEEDENWKKAYEIWKDTKPRRAINRNPWQEILRTETRNNKHHFVHPFDENRQELKRKEPAKNAGLVEINTQNKRNKVDS